MITFENIVVRGNIGFGSRDFSVFFFFFVFDLKSRIIYVHKTRGMTYIALFVYTSTRIITHVLCYYAATDRGGELQTFITIIGHAVQSDDCEDCIREY